MQKSELFGAYENRHCVFNLLPCDAYIRCFMSTRSKFTMVNVVLSKLTIIVIEARIAFINCCLQCYCQNTQLIALWFLLYLQVYVSLLCGKGPFVLTGQSC